MTTVEGAVGATRLVEVRRLRTWFVESFCGYLIGSVAPVTAETLAVARVVFGCALLFFYSGYNSGSLTSLASSGPLPPFLRFLSRHTDVFLSLSVSPQACYFVYWSTFWLIVAFIAGFLTRLLYPILVVLFWVNAFLQNHGHFMTPLLLAMTATAAAPWSERWSVDALVWRRPNQPWVASPFYGYGIWLLGLTIGLTYCAAGMSKLILTSGGWLWDTGARNGFIQDIRFAVTDWGMLISNNYVLALGASILSAVGQAVYVWASFTRSPTVKYGIGIFIAIPFLIGLILFMGLFWWPWAVLVLMLYFPWPLIDKAIARGRAVIVPFSGSGRVARHRILFLVAATALIGVHAFAIVTRSEFEPLYSNYPMYADRMRAATDNEREFWDRFQVQGRNYKHVVRVVGTEGTSGRVAIRDLTMRYDLAYFLYNNSLLRLQTVRLSPEQVLDTAARALPIEAGMCKDLRALALSMAPSDMAPKALQYAKRRYELVGGRLEWLPVDSWIEVDITSPACPYRQSSGHIAALLPVRQQGPRT
jgi:hypothetical protein